MLLIKKYHLLGALLLLAAPVAADDFGLWPEVGVEKKLGRFSIEATTGLRFNNNVGSTSRFDIGLGGDYKVCDYLKVGAGYVYIDDHKPRSTSEHYKNSDPTQMNGYNVEHSYWRSKHRIYVQATGKYEVARFTFTLRERYQLTRFAEADVTEDKYRGIISNPENYADSSALMPNGNYYAYDETETDTKQAKTKHYLRSRIGVAYNIRHCPVDPFASFEISNNLSNGFSLDKRRWIVGADWKIAKQHKLSVSYVYTNGNDDDDDDNLHAISVGYKFSF